MIQKLTNEELDRYIRLALRFENDGLCSEDSDFRILCKESLKGDTVMHLNTLCHVLYREFVIRSL